MKISEANNLCIMYERGDLCLFYRYNYTKIKKASILIPRLDSNKYFGENSHFSKGFNLMREKMLQKIHKISCEKMIPISISGMPFEKFRENGISLIGMCEYSNWSAYKI